MTAGGRKKLITESEFQRRLHRARTVAAWLGLLLGALPALAALLSLASSPPRVTTRRGDPKSADCEPASFAAKGLQRVAFVNPDGEPFDVPTLWTTRDKLPDVDATKAPVEFRISGVDAFCRDLEITYVGMVRSIGQSEARSFLVTTPGDRLLIDGSPQLRSPSPLALIRPDRLVALPAVLGFAGLALGMAVLFRAGATRVVTTRYEAREPVLVGGGGGGDEGCAAPEDYGHGSRWGRLKDLIQTYSARDSPSPPWLGGGPGAEPPQPRAPEPPAPTYALLRCPEVVVVEEEIELEVGISPVPMEDVEGEPLRAPSLPEYRLTIHVLAQGFRLRPGESWLNELEVTAARRYPSLVLHLTAEPQDRPVRSRRIRANYLVEGQSIGFAVRAVSVVERAELVREVEAGPHPAATTIGIPGAESAADLTITILQEDSDRGELLWSFSTPHAGIQVPDESISKDVGSDPERFARQLVEKVNAREGKVGLYPFLRGIGREIADHVPPPIWSALREIGTKKPGKPPTVLILSEEPYIPWELAVMPQPLDAAVPPFLAAQASVGRWVLPEADRPRVPPPLQVEVRSAAVISGVYDSPNWRRLEEAEEEARQLARQYRGVVPVDATHRTVTRCLGGDPEADLLHFAVHGIYDPNGIQNGLVLVDEATLDPYDVKGADLRRNPFVFLNACQVGAGDRILGDYAGLAAAFLYAGASGVIAPLWSVKDTIAREIALEFYRRVAAGEPPALILREERARFRDSDEPASATYLAYQFFGHPELRLRGLTSQGQNP